MFDYSCTPRNNNFLLPQSGMNRDTERARSDTAFALTIRQAEFCVIFLSYPGLSCVLSTQRQTRSRHFMTSPNKAVVVVVGSCWLLVLAVSGTKHRQHR